jgi:DNA-binding winged helix-turn-helix (wHTH) protein/tetratricopeptide (TPR) repeat protein
MLERDGTTGLVPPRSGAVAFLCHGTDDTAPAVLLDGTIVRFRLQRGEEAVPRATMDADRSLTFEGYALDLANERLLHEGEVVPLAPKAFAVLRRLVEDGGQVVTKKELLRAGWANTHVTDGVLKVRILEIRSALGDDPAAPRFIETVARRGYRFIARRTRASRTPAADSARGPLVGREDVLTQLTSRLDAARSGQRQIVFLSGEAGIGKTSVLNEFLARIEIDSDLLIAPGACLEHYGVAEAYLPVLEALGRLLREPIGQRLIRLLETHAPTWLVQLPSIEGAGDRQGGRRDLLGVTKERMLREMAEALEVLTATNPLVLVLEDLHWSDYSTLDLLAMLARRQEPARLLVVGSYRPVDVIVKGHPLRDLVHELQLRRQCDDVGLAFLSAADVATYLVERFGPHGFPAAVASAVHERTDGNPLFVVRVVDELETVGVLAERAGRWEVVRPLDEIPRAVPESLRLLIDRQVARLEPAMQRVLEVAALLGEEFTARSVAAGLDDDVVSVEERCDALSRQAHFVKSAAPHVLPDGITIARYRFTHALYPSVLVERMAPGRRSRVHQRVGEWLEQTYGKDAGAIASPLARHFGEAGDYRRAVRYLILTAENTARRFAYRDSIKLLQHALALAANVAASARPELEIELLERIGDAHYWLGAMVECTKSYEAEAARAADAGLTSAQVKALSCLVRPFGLIDPDRGIAAIERAVQLSAGCGDPLLHACTEMLAGSTRLWYDSWRQKDWDLCASASQSIRRLSDSQLPAYHRMIYAHLQVLQGNYAAALGDLESGIPTVNEPTSMMVHFFALSGKTVALLLSGRLGELLRVLREAKELAEKNGNDPWLFIFREAWLRTVVLDFDGARRLCETVTRAAPDYSTGQPQTIARLATGYAVLAQGKYDEALRTFAQVLDPQITPKFFLHWYWRMNAQLGLSNTWLASGNLRNARAEADRFREAALSTAEPNLQALAWEVAARVAMAEKDWSGAEDHIEKGLEILERFEIPTTAWRVHATRSDLYRHAKNDTAAETHRARAEALILGLANSFAPDEPLRDVFLAGAMVRRIRRPRKGNTSVRQRRSGPAAT